MKVLVELEWVHPILVLELLVSDAKNTIDILVGITHRVPHNINVVAEDETILQVLQVSERDQAPVGGNAIHLKAVVRRSVTGVTLRDHGAMVHLETGVNEVASEVRIARNVRVNHMKDQAVPMEDRRIELHLQALLPDVKLNNLRQDVV